MSPPEQVKNFFVTFLHLSSVYLLICWTYRLDNCVKFENSPGGKTEMAFEDKSLREQKKGIFSQMQDVSNDHESIFWNYISLHVECKRFG